MTGLFSLLGFRTPSSNWRCCSSWPAIHILLERFRARWTEITTPRVQIPLRQIPTSRYPLPRRTRKEVVTMPNDLSVKEPLLDRFAVSTSRALARRLPRRTFLGKVGLYATAAVVGASASTLLSQDPALARSNCGCTGGNSVSCQCLTGTNACPSGTCQCGCWTVCNSSICAFPNSVNWCDCCNNTAHS